MENNNICNGLKSFKAYGRNCFSYNQMTKIIIIILFFDWDKKKQNTSGYFAVK